MTAKSKNHPKPVRRGPYPELTVPALLIGYLLGVLIAVSISYAALILGFTIEGSEIAAILGFGILRGLMGRTSIVENNINQTIASSVNGATAGMMFSIPALFILGHGGAFDPYLLTFGCIVGGILGIAFIIPLRKQMIDFNRLAFPGGIAVAEVLKSPGAGMRKAVFLVIGALISAGLHAIVNVTHFEDWHLGATLGTPEYLNITLYVSLLTVGAAFLAGKGGIYFVVGGYTCYWVLSPILASQGYLPTPDQLAEAGTSIPGFLRGEYFRPIGIGMIFGGAMAGIVWAIPLIVSAVRSMQEAAKTKSALSRDEMPIRLLYVGVAGAFVLLVFIAIRSVADMGIGRGLLMALFGTFWIWMAGVIVSECIGRTNWSPTSGMTLIAVTILIFIASSAGGLDKIPTIVAAVLVGAAMGAALSQAKDLMMDLKTGYLVGASPKKQQIAQFTAVWLGPIVVLAVIFILHKAYGLGSERLPAPQGKALASMIEGILGGDIPLRKYLGGAGLGMLLSSSGIGGLGVLVGLGFYLPFNIVLTYTVGTAVRLFSDWKLGHRFTNDVGIPMATGLMVGEALIGVAFALQHVLSGIGGSG
jgi:putative OPT family oligopeptide transporter